MAMSSLQAQLASLHSQSSKNPGSSLSTSKRHEDATGRGLAHSVQHGHAINRDAKFKASILHSDAKAASDVPLTILRENALVSLERLQELRSEFSQYQEPLFGVFVSEPGLSTKAANEQRNESIRSFLFLLGTIMTEEPTHGLHIMEYLIRRFDIHIKNVDALLSSMLAHHEEPFYSKLLQLVDLANDTTWYFLRPYAAPNAPTIPRNVLAQRASKTSVMFKSACELASLAAAATTATNVQSRGTSHVISFGAAMVVEGLTCQVTASGSIDEASVRVVLPFCLQACKSANLDWRGFGYMVAACLAEFSSVHVADALSLSITEGVAKEENLQHVADGVVAILAIVSSIATDAMTTSTLAMIGNKDETHTFIGYTLPFKAFRGLSSVPLLSEALSALQNAGFVVQHLVASIVVVALQNNRMKLITELLQNHELWTDTHYHLVSSLTYHVIHTAMQSQNQEYMDAATSILRSLAEIDSIDYDRGVAHAVTENNGNDDPRLATLLGLSSTASLLPPRLALEHADASIRLLAIPASTDFTALLRHFTTEDDLVLVLASGRAALAVLNDNVIDVATTQSILGALQQWAIDKKEKANEQVEIGKIAVSLASHAVKVLLQADTNDETFAKLIQGMIAHLDSTIANHAATSLCFAFSTMKKKSGDDMKVVKDLIVLDKRITQALLLESSSKLTRRSQLVFADFVTEKLKSKTKGKAEMAQIGIACCLSVLSSEVRKSEGPRLLACIQHSVEHLSLLTQFDGLIRLCSVESEKAFQRVARESIIAICSAVETSPISLLLEHASRDDSSLLVVKRILQIVNEIITPKESSLAIVPTLALLAHTDHEVRKAALTLLGTLEPLLSLDAKVFSSVGTTSSSVLLNGAMALPESLRHAVKEAPNPETSKAFLLESCVALVANEALIRLDAAAGALRCCAIVLSAAEFAAESVFPITERWNMAGCKIVSLLMNASVHGTYAEGPTEALLQVLGRMLKGATVVDSSSLDMDIIISTGPSSRGTRARSYSVGRSKGVALLHPYPEDMVDVLIGCFNQGSGSEVTPIVQSMCSAFLLDVVGRESWGEGIFKKLSASNKINLAFALIMLRASGTMDIDASPLLSLPLDAVDVCALVAKGVEESMNLAALTFTMDYIRANATVLAEQKAAAQLITCLFEVFGTLASTPTDSDDDIEFTSHSILLAISKILKNETTKLPLVPKDRISSYTTTLLELTGSGDTTSNEASIPLKSWKAKRTALDLLASVCHYHPKTVGPMLLRALVSCTITNRSTTSSETSTELILRTTRDTFIAMVPVIIEFSSESGLSIFDVFSTILRESKSVEDEMFRNHLYRCMVDALLLSSKGTTDCNLGLFLSCLLSSEVTTKSLFAQPSQLILLFLQDVPAMAQIESLKEFIAVATSALSRALGEEVDTQRNHTLESILAMSQSKQPSSTEYTATLASHLIRLVLDTLRSPVVEQFVKKGSKPVSSLSLEIWQDLLLVQSSAVALERNGCRGSTDTDAMTDNSCDVSRPVVLALRASVDDSLTALQNMLPVHIFLASVSCLIEDGSSAELQSKALRFVAERASIVELESPEAMLFLDIVPTLVSLFDSFESNATMEGFVVQQAIVVAIEQIARSIILPNVESKNGEAFAPAMASVSRQLDHFSTNDDILETDAVCQLICSMALCVATLVKTLKARCLPLLPKLISSFLTFLSKANQVEASSLQHPHATLLQLSSIRSISAMAQSVPQFLVPHLNALLAPAMLSSRALQGSTDGMLVVMVEQLGKSLATSIPCRQFVPAACKALSTCTHVEEYMTLLSMIQQSMEHAPQAEIPSVRNYVVKAILLSFEFEDNTLLLDAANGVALALVMKLSEVQLVALFTKMCEWRGEDDARQHAFWNLAAMLSSELKSIFFSCMSTVIVDAIKELNSIVEPVVAVKGSKKQKLADKSTMTAPRYLDPLLRCLEFTLKADAHEGGQWIRGEESRYHSLLKPLMKLLQRVSVVDAIPCITALACAAGNEQLWKPLNHDVLEACSNEDQALVRNAGIRCLLSLIQTLGEEYMVLLPECLPVLSEMLEDSDEVTAGLAQECVTLSEELLGESLQDSLR